MPKNPHFPSLILLLLFVYCTLSQSPSCLSQCSQMKYFNCQICYQICQLPIDPTTPNGTVSFSFNYQSCKEEYCVRYETYTYTSGNQTRQETYCAEYGWLNHTQDECIQQCCNHPSYHQFTNLTFAQCVAANQQLHQKLTKISMILGIAFGSIFAIIICFIPLVCCCRACKDYLSQCFNSSNNSSSLNRQVNIPYLQNQVINVSNVQLKEISHSLEKVQIHKLKWINTESNMKQSVSEYCSICLDGNMNCQTSCGHKFHLLCFQDWIRKSADCPLCKSKNFNEMRIYCERCKVRQSSFSIKASINLDCMNGNQIACNECMDKGGLDVDEGKQI